MSGSKVVVILTGSIACYKACEVVSRLVQGGHRVRTVTTESARRFVGDATLEGLTGEAVRHDLFAMGGALDHIELARWAKLILVCPATAHSLNRFAAGLADDLAGALLLARQPDTPLVFAPAMNPAMWTHPATQASVRQLEGWGARFVPVGIGRTACGEEGPGRLAEPELIAATVDAELARPTRRLRVLVTSGGTTEPVDGVRTLTNISTGYTGMAVAAHFARRGHDVVLLRARHAIPAAVLCREEIFFTFADLDAALSRLLATEAFDVVIHAAAVGDFGLDAIECDGVSLPPGRMKLDSNRPVKLALRPLPKLLGTLRAQSRNSAVKIVAFKLTSGVNDAGAVSAMRSLFAQGADLVVHNELGERGAQPDDFPARLFAGDGAILARCASRGELSHTLESHFASTGPKS